MEILKLHRAVTLARFLMVRSTPDSLDDLLPVVVGLVRRHPPVVVVEDYEVLHHIVARATQF
jgi:hypothetical protein